MIYDDHHMTTKTTFLQRRPIHPINLSRSGHHIIFIIIIIIIIIINLLILVVVSLVRVRLDGEGEEVEASLVADE